MCAVTTIALFNIMRFPFAFLPMGFLQFIQSRIALRRLSRYLELSELSTYVVPSSPPQIEDAALTIDDPSESDPAIVINNGNFSWIDPNHTPAPEPKKRMSRKERRASAKALKQKAKEDALKAREDAKGSLKSHPSNASMSREESLASLGVSVNTTQSEEDNAESRIALKNITCSIERGSLVAIIGSVGSGKSSLLSAILGEMEALENSQVYMPPSKDGGSPRENLVSYCSQSPWVVNDTLKGNILFGRPYDEARYNEVVKACALVDDLAILPAGDMTEIGKFTLI